MSEKSARPKPAKSSKSAKSANAATSATSIERADPAAPSPQERYIEDLLARGEAARRDEDGNLPPGATYEIVDDPEGGPPKLVRRRFSIS